MINLADSWWLKINYWMSQSSADWSPIGQVMDWNPVIIALFVVTGCIMAACFFSIAGLAIYGSIKKGFFTQGQKMTTYFFLTFFILCGSLFLLREVTLFYPIFWFYGGVKIITAFTAIMAVVLHIKYLSLFMQIPSKSEWTNLKKERDEAINKNEMLTRHLSVWGDSVGKHIKKLKMHHQILADDLADRELPMMNTVDISTQDGKEEALKSLDKIHKELELLTSNIKSSSYKT